ncbi:hypothetical protein Y032_0004g1981 [Ancylostoma ceylanicum]|uniref:Uncharacterized protein n=1 Tax=Ancylostoma ceylanicum TaxID=53326 RepID=A0A016VUS2_9BILA|nr:hypothetical protein Y032_0004g1981 [Ancylostoma ceylanicum]
MLRTCVLVLTVGIAAAFDSSEMRMLEDEYSYDVISAFYEQSLIKHALLCVACMAWLLYCFSFERETWAWLVVLHKR